MIELPRAALTADKIAEDADFFSFGTNDLTQTVRSACRATTPVSSCRTTSTGRHSRRRTRSCRMDTEGVGELVRIAVEKGRRTKNDLKLGICGEHGGDPASIAFCEEVGLDYVSCSPLPRPRRPPRRRPGGPGPARRQDCVNREASRLWQTKALSLWGVG